MSAICEGCGATFSPNRPDQRCCYAACRARAHRQRPKKHALSAAVPWPIENVCGAPAGLSVTLPGQEKALRQCIRLGNPPGLLEGIDGDGLSIFFEGEGDRLLRVWGPNGLSGVEVRTMRLEETGLAFEGGRFYRRVRGGHR